MNSLIAWVGGKKQLRKEIISRFPKNAPKKYVEVFGGAAWVLFGKERNSKQLEVLNDYNSDLITLFRCVKYHPDELHKECQFFLNSRELFNNYREQMSLNGLTDIQRSARFLYLVKTSYGATIRSYGMTSKNIYNSIDMIKEISDRLKTVVIENKNYDNLIKVYDSIDTLFYLDPPYYQTEKYYDASFTAEDHINLSNLLRNMKGKFILSYNDDPYIRELYHDFKIENVERTNNLNSKNYHEIIISNY